MYFCVMTVGRPSDYNIEICLEVCEDVALGGNIMTVLSAKSHYPSWSTFRRWKRDNEELRTLYINSQQDKAEALEKEMDDYRDMLIAKEIDASTYNTLVQTLKWKMSKYYSKMYGDKLDMTSDGKAIDSSPKTIQIEITRPNED